MFHKIKRLLLFGKKHGWVNDDMIFTIYFIFIVFFGITVIQQHYFTVVTGAQGGFFCLPGDVLFTAILGAFNYKLFTNLGLLQTLPAEALDNQQHIVRL